MDLKSASPQDLKYLIISGDVYNIYRSIQYSADLGLKELQKTEKIKKFDPELGSEIRDTIKQTLNRAGELRFLLNTVNNKLLREQRLDVTLKNLTNNKTADFGMFFLACLNVLTEPNSGYSPAVIDAVGKIQDDIKLSIGFRIQIISCWDEILVCHQELLAEQVVYYGQRVSEIATIIKDEDALRKIRSLLDSINIEIKESAGDLNLPDSISELKNILYGEIESLEYSCCCITMLNGQREKVRSVHSELVEQYKRSNIKPDDHQTSSQSITPPSVKRKPGSRMFIRKRGQDN